MTFPSFPFSLLIVNRAKNLERKVWYLIPIFFLGFMTPVQTAANSRLRQAVASPIVASLVSFSVGTVFLAVVTLLEKGSLFFDAQLFGNLPWWAWLGGVCGLYGLTVNIVIFPKIGAVQTALMPMLGQIGMGVIIDSFGLLNSQVFVLTGTRILALAIVLAGIVLIVVKKDRSRRGNNMLPWQFMGISGGAVFAMQPSMNSLLSAGLFSSVHAAFFSFLSATVILYLIVFTFSSERMHFPKIFSTSKPWWAWLGGIIGGTFVTGFAFFASKTGIGILLATSICGMLTNSLIIDRFGFFGTQRKDIRAIQYFGLILVMSGIIMLKLNE